MFSNLQVRCDSTIFFSAGAVMQLRGVVRLFSRCVASRKANNDHPNTLHHMILSMKSKNFSYASMDNSSPGVVATIFKSAENELPCVAACGNPTGEIFDGSKRGWRHQQRSLAPRMQALSPLRKL